MSLNKKCLESICQPIEQSILVSHIMCGQLIYVLFPPKIVVIVEHLKCWCSEDNGSNYCTEIITSYKRSYTQYTCNTSSAANLVGVSIYMQIIM